MILGVLVSTALDVALIDWPFGAAHSAAPAVAALATSDAEPETTHDSFIDEVAPERRHAPIVEDAPTPPATACSRWLQTLRLWASSRTPHGPVGVAATSSGAERALLLVAPAITWRGVVLGPDGAALSGVSIAVEGVDLSDHREALTHVRLTQWLPSTTDAAGAIERRDLPAELGRIRFAKEGYRAVEVPLGAHERAEALGCCAALRDHPRQSIRRGALVGRGPHDHTRAHVPR